MWYLLKAAAMRAIWMSMAGLGLGTVAGMLALTVPAEAEAVAAYVAGYYWMLVGLLWAALAVISLNDVRGPERVLYSSLPRMVVFALLVSVLAAGLASALFYAMASNVPVFAAGLDPVELREAIIAHVGVGRFLQVTAITAGGALAIGGWAHRRAAAG